MTPKEDIILEVSHLNLTFGGNKVLDDVNMKVKKEIFAIIGPNGAGKTCLLNCINKFYKPDSGTIYLEQQDISMLTSHKIAELGIARTFQNIELFGGLTTVENILAGRHIRFKSGIISGALYFGRGRKEEVKHRHFVEEIIDFLEIEDVREQKVEVLPYGLQKRVELGRALALEPKLLLLDEPMAGMNLEEKEDMARFVIDIYEERGIPVIIIEHDMGVVMDIAENILVLDFGRVIATGTPEEISANQRVIDAYLGK